MSESPAGAQPAWCLRVGANTGGAGHTIRDTRHTMLKVLDDNTRGQDYFVGDLHGCYEELMHTLDHLGFDPARDRLISVGDLVDRGPDSGKCLELVKAPWFHAVRGNHEQMMIDCHLDPGDAAYDYVMSGGDWFVHSAPDVQRALAELADTLPLFLQVPLGGRRIGVVHGDFLETAWITQKQLKRMATDKRQDLRQTALWGRSRISRGTAQPVKDVDLVVCGHTVVEEVCVLGNVLYIDTGACFGGNLTVLLSEELLALYDLEKKREPRIGVYGLWC